MGQITRLLRSTNEVESTNPVGNTSSITPDDGSVLGQLLAAVHRQHDDLSISETTIINSGRTIRFTYTNDHIEDVDLPESVKAVSYQRNGDTDILTITDMNGNMQVFNISVGREYEVLPNSSNVHISREDFNEDATKLTIFKISVDSPEIPSISVSDKDATLSYNERKTIATINGTDIHVTLPEKPVVDIETEFYDITVRTEFELFKAIAVSRGYPINKIDEIVNMDNQDYIRDGVYPYNTKRVFVRIHFAADITLNTITGCNLSTVEINGNNYRLELKKELDISGRNVKIKDLVFVALSNYAANELESKWGFYFWGDDGVHNRYVFERCRFCGYVSQENGRSNRFMSIHTLSEVSTSSVSFYFCSWGTNSGSGNNTTLAADGKIWVHFEKMGSSNIAVIYNLGAGEVGGHTCKRFQVHTQMYEAGEILYDNSSDFSLYVNEAIINPNTGIGRKGTLTIRNILSNEPPIIDPQPITNS